MVGFDGTGVAADCSAVALSFPGRPLGRNGLSASVDGEGQSASGQLEWMSVHSWHDPTSLFELICAISFRLLFILEPKM
jgi:hypothetical protein